MGESVIWPCNDMESDEDIKLRKQSLKPIQTKIPNGTSPPPPSPPPSSSSSSSSSSSEEEYDICDEEESDKEEEMPLSPTSRLFQEPKLNLHVVSIIGLKSKIDPVDVKANLPDTLLKNYRFSSVLVEDEEDGIMKWVRTKVDLDKHVIIPEVDESARSTRTSGDKFIEDYVHDLTKTYLNDEMSRPLWDLHILDIKTSEAESTAILRVHHSLGDGISLMSVLLSCTRQTSDPKASPTLITNKSNTNRKSEIEKGGFATKLLLFLFGIWWFLRLFLNTTIDLLVVAVSMFLYPNKGLPKIKGRPGTTQRTSRRIVFKNVSLDDLKLVKNTLNTTINVVVVGATQAGLSMYYDRRYGLESKIDAEGQNEKENKDSNPKKLIRLRSVVIVSVRQLVGFQLSNKIGNWIGYALLPLNIKLRDDPLDYVREAKANLDRKRHSLEAICTFGTIGLVYKIFGIKLASALFRRSSSSSSIAFSNLVGPLEEINFHGYSISYVASSTYGQPVELMVSFQSYMDKMSIVLSGDEDFFPELHELCDDIAESLRRITNSVKEKEAVKEKDI